MNLSLILHTQIHQGLGGTVLLLDVLGLLELKPNMMGVLGYLFMHFLLHCTVCMFSMAAYLSLSVCAYADPNK
jgi:hypothetical protein